MLGPFYNLDLPDELKAVASLHQQHVADLTNTLRSAGLNDQQIEHKVDQVLASYRCELVEAMKAFKR